MNSSDNFGLNLPEQTDSYDVEHMNDNTRAIDTLLNERMAVKTITADKNLNTMRESGIYFLSQNNTHTNMPPNCTNGWLIVINNSNSVKQVFLRRGSASTHSNAYTRLLSGTGDLIGDWVRYLTELELGLFTDLELDPQATNVVQALNDLYSYCANQFANKNHTHNYAGSSSAGGSATSAVKLQTARTIQTKLNSTSSASFDGTANITPGVTGVLPVANGGTGQDTLSDAYNALIRSKNYDGDQTIYDDDRLTIEHEEIEGEFNILRTSFACVWKYIKGCIASIFGLSESTLTTKNMEKSLIGSLDTDYTYYTSDNENSCFLPSLEDTYNGRVIKKRPISSIIGLLGSVGSSTRPVYFQYGYPVQCDYTLNKSVPSDAKFTDTTYSNATTSTAGLMSATDKSKLDTITVGYLTMGTLGLKGKTSSVADFFSALVAKGYDKLGVLHFRYETANAGNITGSDITISINGCQCILTTRRDAWDRKNAIISLQGKTYNVWAQYDKGESPAHSGIVDLSANTWRPVQNNLTSTSTSDCLSAYQGKLLNEKVQLLEGADTFKLTNNSYIKIKGNVVTFYSYGGASTTSALNSIKLQSKYRPPYPIHIAGYICRVGYTSRYPAYLSIGSDGVMGVYFMQQTGGDAIYHNGTDYWFDGCGTWLNQTS